ncbi:5494_t:CDS:2, partial [Cetraspora pellucida]
IRKALGFKSMKAFLAHTKKAQALQKKMEKEGIMGVSTYKYIADFLRISPREVGQDIAVNEEKEKKWQPNANCCRSKAGRTRSSSFDKMINACSHEIAHYTQHVKHNKSSCESDLKLNNGEYDKELAKEHKEWTGEIYQLIKSEYSERERRWREIG